MIALVAIGFITGRGQRGVNAPVPANDSAIRRSLRGVTLTPKSFQADDFQAFFVQAKQAGDLVSWAGDWSELANTSSGGPTVVASLASTYGYTPVIEAQFFTQSTGRLLRPLTEATKAGYRAGVVEFVTKFQPEYLGLGIEVNVLAEKSPADFEAFVGFFSEVYDAVKLASPGTKVFTIWQLERMKGLNGGLFGGTNDPDQAQWSLLERFPKSDLIAFTTYPGLIYSQPTDLPTDYYLVIARSTTKPIAFTEIGWHSAGSPAGWESSEAEQAEFIRVFLDRTKDLSPTFILWSFLFDQNTIEPFRSMGLYRSDGGAKAAWNEWVKPDGNNE